MSSLLLLVVSSFVQHKTWNDRSLLFGTPVERDGFHLQLTLGLGGAANNEGLFHTLEVGKTFSNGLTVAAMQAAVQNRGVLGPDRGADAIGAWLCELKVPVVFPEFEVKVAAGVGWLLDELRGWRVIPGFGWAYGLDVHLPFFASSGATVGLTFLHALVPAHYFTVGVGVGYTFF